MEEGKKGRMSPERAKLIALYDQNCMAPALTIEQREKLDSVRREKAVRANPVAEHFGEIDAMRREKVTWPEIYDYLVKGLGLKLKLKPARLSRLFIDEKVRRAQELIRLQKARTHGRQHDAQLVVPPQGQPAPEPSAGPAQLQPPAQGQLQG